MKFDEDHGWEWEENQQEDGYVWERLVDESDEEGETEAIPPEEEVNTEAEVPDTPRQEEESEPELGDISGTAQRESGGRRKQVPVWMKDYVGLFVEEDEEEYVMVAAPGDPENFREAVQDKRWREAMEAEIKSIEENDTWELVELPMGTNVIGVKWVFKTKYNEKGEVDKFKARLVAKGYHQRQGIDFHEVFAPVAR